MEKTMEHINALLAAGKHREAAPLIRQRLALNGSFEGGHVRCAHALALDNDWDAVTRLLPPGTNMLETSGWLQSLQAGRPVDRQGAPIPWMNYGAIDFIGAKITADMRVFEWGAGFSSLWFAKHVKEVISIEENVAWYRELKPQLPSNVALMCLPARDDYVRAIRTTTGEFDVIVIDGVHRNECASESISRLSANGMVVFDNSDGSDYDSSMAMFNQAGFLRIDFWGLIPSYLYKNCTSILFRNPALLRQGVVPSQQNLSTGISCMQAVDRAAASR
jgi:hypothetical protein